MKIKAPAKPTRIQGRCYSEGGSVIRKVLFGEENSVRLLPARHLPVSNDNFNLRLNYVCEPSTHCAVGLQNARCYRL